MCPETQRQFCMFHQVKKINLLHFLPFIFNLIIKKMITGTLMPLNICCCYDVKHAKLVPLLKKKNTQVNDDKFTCYKCN